MLAGMLGAEGECSHAAPYLYTVSVRGSFCKMRLEIPDFGARRRRAPTILFICHSMSASFDMNCRNCSRVASNLKTASQG